MLVGNCSKVYVLEILPGYAEIRSGRFAFSNLPKKFVDHGVVKLSENVFINVFLISQ